jgi:hypothetical protein
LLGPNWFYRPRFVVQANFLTGSLFVRLRSNHYYFGDYFDPHYSGLGYTSWVDFRIGRNHYDPLYAHLRWENRKNPRWEHELHSLYAGRRAGEIPRPPRTLVQQNTVVQNIKNQNIQNVNVQNVTVLASLKEVKQTNPNVKLQDVPPAKLDEQKKNAQQFRELTKERRKISEQVIARGSPLATPDKSVAAPVKVDLPKARPTVPISTVKAPEPPAAAKPTQVPKKQPIGTGTQTEQPGRRPTPVRPGEDRQREVVKPGEQGARPTPTKPIDTKPVKPGEKPPASKPGDATPANPPAPPNEKGPPKVQNPAVPPKPPADKSAAPKGEKPPAAEKQPPPVRPPISPLRKDDPPPKADRPAPPPPTPAVRDRPTPPPKAEKSAPPSVDRSAPPPPSKTERPPPPPSKAEKSAPPRADKQAPPPPSKTERPAPPPPKQEKPPPKEKEKEKGKEKDKERGKGPGRD